MDCWVGALTFEACCQGTWGVGQPLCWDPVYTWETCCEAQLQAQLQVEWSSSLQATAAETAEAEARSGNTVGSLDAAAGEAAHGKASGESQADGEVGTEGAKIALGREVLVAAETFARSAAAASGLDPGAQAGQWLGGGKRPHPEPELPDDANQQELVVAMLHQCIDQYDDANYRQWFMSQSGIVTHPLASLGNPAACLDGGHHFYWGLVSLRVGQLHGLSSLPDMGLQFGICVPARCHGHAVSNLVVPFYMGPYLAKPWGPRPPWLEHFAEPGKAEGVEAWSTVAEPSLREWATEVSLRREFFQEQWVFPLALWKYERHWWPSRANIVPLISLAFLPCLAGVTVAASDKKARCRAAHQGAGARLWAWFIDTFAPQRRLAGLWAARSDDASMVHMLRFILQGLVCFQHAVFLVDWLGNEGHDGLSSFAPLVYAVAQVLGRVNTTFACLSAHVVARSVAKALTPKSKQGPNSRHSGSCGAAFCVVLGWCARRWLLQTSELGLWTFYYLRISRDVPWRPFPEFVNVWYQSRIDYCLEWPSKGGLPMWILSSLFLYEPVNYLFGWHTPKLSLCHNLQIFELLFTLSCVVAALTGIRYSFGSRTFLGIVGGMLLLSIIYMPYADLYGTDGESKDASDVTDWRWNILPQTLPRLLPASLITMMISLNQTISIPDAWGLRCALWWLAAMMMMLTFSLDFLMWAQGHISSNWRFNGVPYLPALQAGSLLLERLLRGREWQRFLVICFELPHVLAVSLILRLMEHRPQSGFCPGWLLLLSRLSLGVNLGNIFALHYITARLHDFPVEYSFLHLALYTLVAWLVASVLAACSHCLIAPYVTMVLSLRGALGRATLLRMNGHEQANGNMPANDHKRTNGNGRANGHHSSGAPGRMDSSS